VQIPGFGCACTDGGGRWGSVLPAHSYSVTASAGSHERVWGSESRDLGGADARPGPVRELRDAAQITRDRAWRIPAIDQCCLSHRHAVRSADGQPVDIGEMRAADKSHGSLQRLGPPVHSRVETMSRSTVTLGADRPAKPGPQSSIPRHLCISCDLDISSGCGPSTEAVDIMVSATSRSLSCVATSSAADRS
jgi:hypothetical protein